MTAFVKTDETISLVTADNLIWEVSTPHLFAYNGNNLVGVWKMEDVKTAYLVERKEQNANI